MCDAHTAVAKILCVEDNEDARTLIAEILRDYHLTFAATGYEAIRSLNSGVFDLYLLDLWLPDWSGIQLARHIRQSDPRVPIVFCTAAGRDEDRRRAMSAGATAYLMKPVDLVRLREEVETLLALARSESLRAHIEEERAIQDELDKRAEEMRKRSAAALDAARSAIERATRVKALRVFLDAGGTLSSFERSWSPTYSDAWEQRRSKLG